MDFDDKQLKTSLFKDALGQIQRLNAAWIRATRHRESGNLTGWRWILDTVYLELSYDVQRLRRDKGLDFETRLEELNKQISAAFRNKNDAEQYKLLFEKEKILREVQEQCQPAGSKVLMANGEWKNIEDIKVGDEVLSPQEDGSIVFAKVIRTHSFYSDYNYSFTSNKNKKLLFTCTWNTEIPIITKKRNKRIIQTITAEEFTKKFKKNSAILIYKNKKKSPNRKIVNVVTAKPCKVYGFTLDSPSGWYVTDNFCIIHNSGKGSRLIDEEESFI